MGGIGEISKNRLAVDARLAMVWTVSLELTGTLQAFLSKKRKQLSPLTSTLIDTRWAITRVVLWYMSSSVNFGALVHIFFRGYVPRMIAEFT